jgi:ceramide synthetase
MVIHHVATAILCIGSWCFGYLRVGSAVMFLHDVSDVPLDLVRTWGAVNQKGLQIASMILTLLMWGYWR